MRSTATHAARSVVSLCVCVCLYVGRTQVSRAETAEAIEMPFGGEIQGRI